MHCLFFVEKITMNENLNIDINKEILDAIDIMLSKALKSMPYDVTRTARIVGVNGHTYTVLLDGTEYNVVSSLTFKINETVNVLIRQNNLNSLCLLPN